MLGDGKDVADVCRELQVSQQTHYRWRNQFGGLKADDAKRLKDLERENATLKRLLAAAELEKAARVSERFVCRVTGQNRTTQRRPPAATTSTDPDAALQAWLRTSVLRLSSRFDQGCAPKTWATAPPLKAVVLIGSMVSGAVKSCSPEPRTTGWMTRRYSSIKPVLTSDRANRAPP